MKTKTKTQRKPTLAIAASAEPKPGLSTRALAALAKRYYALGKEQARIERQMKPLKARLLAAVPQGKSLAGRWAIQKTHYDAAHIPACTRNAYDTIKVEEL